MPRPQRGEGSRLVVSAGDQGVKVDVGNDERELGALLGGQSLQLQHGVRALRRLETLQVRQVLPLYKAALVALHRRERRESVRRGIFVVYIHIYSICRILTGRFSLPGRFLCAAGRLAAWPATF